MLNLLLMIILLTAVHASVECRFNFPGVGETKVSSENKESCRELIQDQIRAAYLTGRICSSGSEFKFNWGSGAASEESTVSCHELEAYRAAETTLEASSEAQSILGDPGIAQFNLEDLCPEDAPGIDEIPSFRSGGFVVTLGDDELRDVIKEFKLATGKTEEEIFRLIKDQDGSEFRIPYLIEKPEGVKEESAVKISFKKERNGVTSMRIQNDTGTQSGLDVRPHSQIRLSHIDAFYLEERVSRLVLSNADRGKAFFWSVDGGVHKIYGNNDGNGRLLTRTHEIMEFFNIPEKDPSRPEILYQGYQRRKSHKFVGVQVGTSLETALSSTTAIGFVASVEARGTTLDGASYVGANAGVKLSKKTGEDSSLQAGVEVSRWEFIQGGGGSKVAGEISYVRGNSKASLSGSYGDASPIPDSMFEQRKDFIVTAKWRLKF